MRQKLFIISLLVLMFLPMERVHARKLYIEPGGEVNAIKVAIEGLVAGDTLYVKSGT